MKKTRKLQKAGMLGSKRVKAREQADLKQNGVEQQWLRIVLLDT